MWKPASTLATTARSSSWSQNSSVPTTSFGVHVDQRGTGVLWSNYSGGFAIHAAPSSLLELDFVDPVREPAYGPSCVGELGCQHGSAPFERVFVASFPGDTTLAWLMGGTQQWHVQFPNFYCPLLVEPQFILGVPLVDGPNGRKFVDFEATFPAVPGLTFYAQGIAIRGGTFIGTNGVVIQT